MEEPTKANAEASLGVTPLGLTIARKQLLEGDDLLEKKQRKQKKMITTTSWTKKKKKSLDDKPPKNASWMALVEGVTLYATCLVLPSLLGMVFHSGRRQLWWNEVQVEICKRSAWICWHAFGAVLPSMDDTEEPEPLTFARNFAPDTYLSDIYVIVFLTLSMALFRVLLVHMLVPNNLAPQQMEALVRCKSVHLLSADYKQSLTPRPEMGRNVITLESLANNNNNNLGGADKENLLPPLPLFPGDDEDEDVLKTPPERPGGRRVEDEGLGYEFVDHPGDNREATEATDTNTSSLRRLSANDLGLSMDTPIQTRPTLTLESAQIGGFLQTCGPRDDNSDQQLLVDDSENDDNRSTSSPPLQEQPTMLSSTPTRSPLEAFLERPHSPTPPTPGEQEEAEGGWKRRGSTASLAAAAAAAVQEEVEDDLNEEESVVLHPTSTSTSTSTTPPRPQRLFAAPRYATAVFRLLYCTMSGAMAWYLFRDADFWPSYVGGHGSTTRCWDLSGSLALAKNLDSDFDHRNTVLRRFFLVQASYHLHSGAFHVFSVALLHILKRDDEGDGNNKKKGWVSLVSSLIHPRALLQHSLSLIFLSVSYVFSSLRRLGAIGMFALDMSSWALHLLQTCLNAPADSLLSKPKVIQGVWALVVLPSFLYFRFFVWPMVGYSAMRESEQWLAQLESTLVPGSALWFRRIFQLWMMLWMGFHAIHFKRLVFHPHIQRIMGTEQRAS